MKEPTSTQVFSDEQIGFFRDQGYLVVDSLLPVQDLQPVISEITGEIDKRAKPPG